MKKMILCILCLCCIVGCSSSPKDKETNYCDEDTNSCGLDSNTNSNQNSQQFMSITMQEATQLFKEKQKGIIYFGYPDCPWCQEAQPILEEVSKEFDIKIYYVRTRDDDKEKLYTKDEKDAIVPYLKDYLKKDDQGELQIYVPLVVSIENGRVIQGHLGTVDEHDAHERKMTESEKNEVKDIYTEIISSLNE